ncbi:guanosine-5'-triphosphate,3'-diphosphate pyrophosphatase [Oxobacter pfennigii]|uniref:Guanosine-5'-triphosphate,3'-diphosphate pyrophosphatase n=1 Tax=Oxobacter pfennigii TaxID=36849 RepID=A0A0P8W4Q4_9CLOT|nr:Ppx/GppA phosphatase family protein [Oxobacter pfennigii]KPU42773.1 guanosine-5'-triphosphate,3'-diphosphate pyrophosphatase [Oxobacter pfennigii]
MLLGAMDIGTNSTRLLIADVDGEVKRIEKHTIITRLGKMVDQSKRLGQEGIDKNINALLRFKELCLSYGIRDVYAIATSAVRDASNRYEFISAVKRETGIDIEVISGEKEAQLGFLGASSVVKEGYCLICDIGGGSTELILGLDGKVIKGQSIDIGSVRITERFSGLNTSEDNIKNAYEYIKAIVNSAVDDIKTIKNISLVGIGGTVTTLAAIDMGLTTYDIDRVHEYKLNKNRVDAIFSRFISLSLEERYNIPGLQRERADVIPMGTLILKTVMEVTNLYSITVSEKDNLDGLLIDRCI